MIMPSRGGQDASAKVRDARVILVRFLVPVKSASTRQAVSVVSAAVSAAHRPQPHSFPARAGGLTRGKDA